MSSEQLSIEKLMGFKQAESTKAKMGMWGRIGILASRSSVTFGPSGDSLTIRTHDLVEFDLQSWRSPATFNHA